MDWLLSLIPWWLYFIAAAVAIGAVWRLLGWQGAIVAGAGLLAVLGYGKGRADASRDGRAKRDREALDHVVIRNEVDDDVAEMGSQDIDQNLAKWNRE